MEVLLTKDEIKFIEKEAQNPRYKLENILIFPEDHKSISRVTPKGLIFVNGNKDTGLTHINERHRHMEIWKKKFFVIINYVPF